MSAETLAKGHSRIGTVREIAERWGLSSRLARAAEFEPAFREMLDCAVVISRRARTLAGAAYAAERRIVLNARLLEQGREKDRDATFIHECAHVLADLAHNRSCRHGARWREMMRLLGEVPNVRHRIPYLSREANAKFIWRCLGCARAYHYVRRPRRKIADCYCAECGPSRGRLREETPE
ncbi:MAG: SprT-like domain-containing protein [Alphaproteobacteria bacterium]|nr:SprT-like domain-containing protein [Alphaproteobacteria bacterium]